jgi:hypothetical protein
MLIFEIFERVPDPRKANHSFRHRFLDVLCIALCASRCGAESFVDMEDYGLSKETWLPERLGLELPHGIPSHDTFNRLFSLLDPKAFEACFMAWTQHLQQLTEGEILAIDGKSVRRSFDTATGLRYSHRSSIQPQVKALCIWFRYGPLSVWAAQARLVLAQQEVGQKSNEMTAVPKLLEMLDKGCIVTPDALNRQKNIAAQVMEGGGDYVLSLKANHLHLFEDVRDYFAWCRGQPGGLARLNDDCDQSSE